MEDKQSSPYKGYDYRVKEIECGQEDEIESYLVKMGKEGFKLVSLIAFSEFNNILITMERRNWE